MRNILKRFDFFKLRPYVTVNRETMISTKLSQIASLFFFSFLLFSLAY